MQKYLFSLLFIVNANFAIAQSSSSFKFSLQYAQTTRPELTNYFQVMSDSLHINDVLDINSGGGFAVGMVFGGDHTEFDAGGGYIRSADEIGSDTANLLFYINNDITYYFGANYLPVNFFLIGGSFVINSANGKSNVSGDGNGEQYLESLPSTDFNIFRGYSVALKAQSGFYVNINEDDGNRLRLTGYYIYGLSNYNFYTISEKRLANYLGEQKTNYTTFGIELAILFGM